MEEVIKSAVAELPVERLKIFLLAVMVGLRRNEIDKLQWPAFRWEENIIRIEATSVFQPKSEDSLGDVEVDAEVMALFRGYHAKAIAADPTCTFVIESKNAPRLDTTYGHYRAETEFAEVIAWLRSKGIAANKPLHTLRKEYGSQVCAKHGIYAASHALRHADIRVTSQSYLDKKERATVGMGHLLKGNETAKSIAAGAASHGKPRAKNARRSS